MFFYHEAQKGLDERMGKPLAAASRLWGPLVAHVIDNPSSLSVV